MTTDTNIEFDNNNINSINNVNNINYTNHYEGRIRVSQYDPSIINVEVCKCCGKKSFDSPKTRLCRSMFILGFFFFFPFFYPITKIKSNNSTKKRYAVASFMAASFYIYSIVVAIVINFADPDGLYYKYSY